MKNIINNHKKLVDQVYANIFKESGKIERSNSSLAIRNYLDQLDVIHLKEMINEK